MRPFIALCAALLALAAWAAPVAVPPLTGPVVDLTQTLDSAQLQALQQRLTAFSTEKGSQLAVLIVPSTGEETLEQFGIRVTDAWKLGRAQQDDGVLLLVAKNDHKLRLEVGRGLEGALNDATSKRIIAETIVPHLKAGDFAGGINAGVTQVLAVISGEALPAPSAAQRRGQNAGEKPWLVLGVILVIAGSMFGGFFSLFLGKPLGRSLGAVAAGGAALLLSHFWVLAALVGLGTLIFSAMQGGGGLLQGNGRGHYWNGGGGGFGGFGGSGGSGGGFSGGGGSFGGGGASGDW